MHLLKHWSTWACFLLYKMLLLLFLGHTLKRFPIHFFTVKSSKQLQLARLGSKPSAELVPNLNTIIFLLLRQNTTKFGTYFLGAFWKKNIFILLPSNFFPMSHISTQDGSGVAPSSLVSPSLYDLPPPRHLSLLSHHYPITLSPLSHHSTHHVISPFSLI